jgi:hypothetical protein
VTAIVHGGRYDPVFHVMLACPGPSAMSCATAGEVT